MQDIDKIFSLVMSLLIFLAGLAFGVAFVLAKAAMLEGLLKRVWGFLPEKIKDTLWYFWFYTLPRRLGKIPEKILLELLDKRNIAMFLEMDYQYSEELVRLYDKFYTNYVIIWDRFKDNAQVYNLLCKLMKNKMIETFKKQNIDRNEVHIRLSPPLSEQRKLEIIIIYDCQEFGKEIQNKMKMSDQNKKKRCIIVPMLIEEVITHVKTQAVGIDKVLIFSILEIPSKEQFEEIDEIKNAGGKIVYAPLISQKIIEEYYKEKYNKER